MRKNSKVVIAIAAVVTVAGVTSILVRHGSGVATRETTNAQMMGAAIPDSAIAQAVQDAHVRVAGFSATNVGGIVVLKGTASAAAALQAAAVVKQLGFTRVANLIVTKTVADDEGIRRVAERQLASTRALDGCTLRVTCTNGILRVEGTSSSELQADVARNVLRGVGAQEVQIALKKL